VRRRRHPQRGPGEKPDRRQVARAHHLRREVRPPINADAVDPSQVGTEEAPRARGHDGVRAEDGPQAAAPADRPVEVVVQLVAIGDRLLEQLSAGDDVGERELVDVPHRADA
jgi:hypothetical protein